MEIEGKGIMERIFLACCCTRFGIFLIHFYVICFIIISRFIRRRIWTFMGSCSPLSCTIKQSSFSYFVPFSAYQFSLLLENYNLCIAAFIYVLSINQLTLLSFSLICLKMFHISLFSLLDLRLEFLSIFNNEAAGCVTTYESRRNWSRRLCNQSLTSQHSQNLVAKQSKEESTFAMMKHLSYSIHIQRAS